MNTILAPATAGMSCFLIRKYIASSKKEVRDVNWDHMSILNGVLCGLVAVTASCAFITDWGAIIIGGLSPLFYSLSIRIFEKLKIEDPAEVFPMHGACGAWGLFAAAFFDMNTGIFYGGNAKILGI